MASSPGADGLLLEAPGSEADGGEEQPPGGQPKRDLVVVTAARRGEAPEPADASDRRSDEEAGLLGSGRRRLAAGLQDEAQVRQCLFVGLLAAVAVVLGIIVSVACRGGGATSTTTTTTTTATTTATTTTTTVLYFGSEQIPGDGYFELEGYDCWEASEEIAGYENGLNVELEECRRACDKLRCAGFILGQLTDTGRCWPRKLVKVEECNRTAGRDLKDWDFWLRESQALTSPSPAPVYEFYMYRSTAHGMIGRYPLGEVNMANLPGALWYLHNEIVTNYSTGTRCPRRFDISELHRFKIKMRPTEALDKAGMHFGPRWAYDQGKCEGRCFSGNMCTGEGDCAQSFNSYGRVIGCNRFQDHYPFPDMNTSYPNGVWYALPLGGRCEGIPTGTRDCTWSFEEAGNLTLVELEEVAPGKDNCCEGVCSDFWHDMWNNEVSAWRAETAKKLFQKKYPALNASLEAPPCDFDRSVWYAQDDWERMDPWR